MADWLVATLDARLQLLGNYDEWLPPVRSRHTRTLADRRAYRDLVIMLATEIFHRERGAPPPTEDALVGTYLQGLPDDGSAELADGTTPTVELRIRTSRLIRAETLLGAAGGRSAISRQVPVPLIAECAILCRKRTAELASRIASLLRASP